MSNYTDWERKDSLPPGCAVPLAVMSFAFALVFFYFVVSRLLFDYPDGSPGLIVGCGAMGVFFLYAAVAIAWRVAKGKPIPQVTKSGGPPPTIEVYHFLPKDDEDGKNER